MKALIVDDEIHCRQNLKHLLLNYCPEITETHEAENVDQAIEIFEKSTPDILFLDVQMPERDGFDLINSVNTSNTSVVFVTAHDKYAIQAIRSGPVAYLLKPLDQKELVEAVQIASKQLELKVINSSNYSNAMIELEEILRNNRKPDKICLTHSKGLDIIEHKNITHVESDNYYSTFHLMCNTKIMMSKTLKHYEEILGEDFVRVHRSFLVNLRHISKLIFDDCQVILSNRVSIPVSRRRVSQVANRLKSSK